MLEHRALLDRSPFRTVDVEPLGANTEEVLGLVVTVALEVELDVPLEQGRPDIGHDEPGLLA